MENYARLKSSKLMAFIAIAIFMLSVTPLIPSPFPLFIIALSALLIPLHFTEQKFSRQANQGIELALLFFSILVSIVVLPQNAAATPFTYMLAFAMLPGLYFVNAHFYRKYKDFSEDKYIYFVVSMLSGFVSLLFFAADNVAMAAILFVFAGCQFIQFAYYYVARQTIKDQGMCTYELIIPTSALIIGHLTGDIKALTAVCFLVIFPLSYYIYRGIIKVITRMHLYAVFTQFILLLFTMFIFEKSIMDQGLAFILSYII